MKILVLPSDNMGIGKYRSVDPHVKLQELYPDYKVDIEFNIDQSDMGKFKEYDMVVFHKLINGDYNLTKKILRYLKKNGVKSMVDYDDHWTFDSRHPNFYAHNKNGTNKLLMNIIKETDYVSTTTKLFAKEISKLNPNVFVIPNAVDPNEDQFVRKPVENTTGRLRVGWLGGSTHEHDLQLPESIFKMSSDVMDQLQFVLCGFDIRGEKRVYDKETGKITTRKIEPQESVWYRYEQIFTRNYCLLGDDPDYIDRLMEFTKFEDETYDLDKAYRRIWTKQVNSYATGYNNFDVALVPLVESKYNSMKSQLKIIEAGFHKKAVIASNVAPYTLDLNSENAMLVETRKNHKQWRQYINRLLNNPELVEEYAEALYETVKDRFDLNKVTLDRADMYEFALSGNPVNQYSKVYV